MRFHLGFDYLWKSALERLVLFSTPFLFLSFRARNEGEGCEKKAKKVQDWLLHPGNGATNDIQINRRELRISGR